MCSAQWILEVHSHGKFMISLLSTLASSFFTHQRKKDKKQTQKRMNAQMCVLSQFAKTIFKSLECWGKSCVLPFNLNPQLLSYSSFKSHCVQKSRLTLDKAWERLHPRGLLKAIQVLFLHSCEPLYMQFKPSISHAFQGRLSFHISSASHRSLELAYQENYKEGAW